MTTRFSLSELSNMLHVPVEYVREAVDTLSADGQLTAESFLFGERNWRIAPSDTKRIQAWILEQQGASRLTAEKPNRRVTRKVVSRDARDLD